MSEFLNEMAGIFARKAKPAIEVSEAQQPVVTHKEEPKQLIECHFVMNDRMRRLRHVGMKLVEGQFVMWSCKGKGLNPTIGLNESVSSHVPSNTGNTRFEREDNFRQAMSKVFLESAGDVALIQAALNSYTGASWSVYKQVKVVG